MLVSSLSPARKALQGRSFHTSRSCILYSIFGVSHLHATEMIREIHQVSEMLIINHEIVPIIELALLSFVNCVMFGASSGGATELLQTQSFRALSGSPGSLRPIMVASW